MALTNFIKKIRNIMRQDKGVNGDAQRIEQLSWMLFLKVYDEKEKDWELNEQNYMSFIPEDCRWRNWAADDGTGEAMTAETLLNFVDNTLFPTLKELVVTPDTPMRGAIVRATFQDANQYMKDGVLLRQVINVVDGIDLGNYEESHAFGDIYEEILRKLQSAGDSGEFYTPRALTDFMAEVINPKIGEKMADFACGTGGFLTSWLKELDKKVDTTEDREKYLESIYGVEKKQFPYTLCITNMLLHDIESPKVYNDNSLTKDVLNYTDDDKFNVILMNPPYGGKEVDGTKNHFPADLRSSETADLFMSVIMFRLAKNGRAAVVLPDTLLFGIENAQIAIKKKLLRDFNLHTIIRLPGSVFSPYTPINTNIIFFNNEKAKGAKEGYCTKETWFYRLDMPEGYKHFSMTKPMKKSHCKPIIDWWNNRCEIVDNETGDEKSRCFSVQELIDLNCNFDQCKFPKEEEEIQRPEELLKKYNEQKETLNEEIEKIVQNFEAILYDNEPQDINLIVKDPCRVLADLVTNIPVRLKKSILQEAIEGRLVPQDPNDEPASVLLDKIRKEKEKLVKEEILKKKDIEETPVAKEDMPFEIPDSWKWCRISTLFHHSAGKQLKGSDTEGALHQYITTSNLYWDRFELQELKSMYYKDSELERCTAKKGDLLVCEGGDVGRSAIWPFDYDICLQNHVHRLRPYCDGYTRYVYYVIWFYKNIGLIGGKGIGIKGFSASVLKDICIPLPPLAEQQRIVKKIEKMIVEIDKLNQGTLI